MAQPVFDDHPLEQYLRDAGETAELMPGGSSEFIVNPQEGLFDDDDSDCGDYAEACPTALKPLLDAIFSMMSLHFKYPSAFVERFKYSVISSSLLSTSLTAPHTNWRGHSPHPPGKLPSDHSRQSSVDRSSESSFHAQQPVHSLSSDTPYYLFFLALSIVTVFFGAGYYILSIALFAASAFLLYIYNQDFASKHDMAPSLDTLNDLISAGDVWDSVVQEVITTLEKEEHSAFNSPSPSIPSHPLRVALHSTLLTTQNQCDNVRQLLSALTSQNELSQLSEMYAPPSPGGSQQTFPNTRPFSLPTTTRQRVQSTPSSREAKRSTWNGSYSSLASAGSPTMQITRRREKRRSDLSALLRATGSPLQSVSAPVSPAGLEGVAEEEDSDEAPSYQQHFHGLVEDHQKFEEVAESNFENSFDDVSFSSAALDMRRKRRSGGLEALGIPQTTSVPSSPPPPLSPNSGMTAFPLRLSRRSSKSSFSPSTLSSASRFTSLQTPRHPLSLSALNLALQGALASKRYACSHLLALRFKEERDDELYWEDVRSVMGLLTTTFADASARLTEALEELEQRRLRDQLPSPFPENLGVDRDEDGVGGVRLDIGSMLRKARSMEEMVSFAPMPSQLTRFAAHVDAISSALNDARVQLEECVAELRKDLEAGEEKEKERRERRRRSSRMSVGSAIAGGGGGDDDGTEDEDDEHPSMQAYERLRRELGLALRECERGREKLLDIVYPPRSRAESHSDDDEDGSMHHDLPALGLDHGSDESDDKPYSVFPVEYDDSSHSVTVVNGPGGATDMDPAVTLDDASSHLLLVTSSTHLPPPGVEQVFEADSGSVGVFTRERSKLSREERIALAKKARESGKGSRASMGSIGSGLDGGDDQWKPEKEKWGPGGEVVQELKDVIWQVGERRRKLAKRMSDGHGRDVTASEDASSPGTVALRVGDDS
ncbi:hypothetical protein D9758_014257 [Tetrapyrgos nigripes]|uniref:Myosin-binding domain-containing protein n=1 Tax=Tetrapyrgos nigripes TaxID=182062 RepID=A0A8H5FI46_9AGAR|nr:hypothetical protein D9758_014257 [Tetrapyrgos nigripes]